MGLESQIELWWHPTTVLLVGFRIVWLRRKPVMNPLKRNPEQSHHLVRPNRRHGTEGRNLLAHGQGLDIKNNLVAGEVFFLTSFLIERNQAISSTTSARMTVFVSEDGLSARHHDVAFKNDA
jgi:hypothetical protein